MEYMVDKAVETFISFVLDKLFEKLSSLEFPNFFSGKESVGDQLKQLKKKLGAASELLNDAEDRQLDEPEVKEWLDKLKDVIYRAQDLVDEIEYEARSEQEHESETNMCFRKKMKFSISLPFVSEFDKTVPGEVADILKDLNVLLDDEVSRGLNKEGTNKNSTTSTGSSSMRRVGPWLKQSSVHGRDDDKEKIMKLLLSNEVWRGEIGVLPIVGMGGLGKTTLAQLIYDDGRLEEHGFELKAWVTVSTDFDFERIIKIILEEMVGSSITSGKEEPTELPRKLRETLRGKKFLIVLDDVWDDNYKNWNVLKRIFEFGRHESKVIVTTRNRNVALIVNTGPDIDDLQLQPVSNDHCWRIFMDHVFDGDSNADQRLQQIGRRLVNKCGGLPLAVISLAGFLRPKEGPQEWEDILNSNVWERCHKTPTGEILPPALWLSYRYLPSCLKQCFAYCSVFFKDYQFGREETILLWMAQGFLESDEKEKRLELEEVGKEYFDNLVSRSLFQKSNVDTSKYVMHDLVHDLALFVSGEFCVTLDHHDKNLRVPTSKTRHLSYVAYNDGENLKNLDLSNKAKHLRTFIGRRHNSAYSPAAFVGELIVPGSRLRVLSPIVDSWKSPVPDSIGNLKQLRYLNLSLSDIEGLPSSICTLYNLQTLLLSRCQHLRRLPNNMRRLINLRHLDITDSPIEEMPPHMDELKQLRNLSNFVLGEGGNGSSIKEIGMLQHLHGKLSISMLQNVDNVDDVRKANLKGKNLSELHLKWENDFIAYYRGDKKILTMPPFQPQSDNMDKIRRDVLDELQPHKNLEKLTICSYAGSNFPSWVGSSFFSKIVSIRLVNNKYCKSLPPLGQLPSLRDLVVESFYGVKMIGVEFYGNIHSTVPFQSLESLSFKDMPKWKEWLFIGHEIKDGCFPRLKRLSIVKCPNITSSLPNSLTIEDLMIQDCYQLMEFLPLDHFQSLKKLVLITCQELESLTFTEESGTAVLPYLNSLKLIDYKNLRSLPQHMHEFPSFAYLEINSCPKLESFPEGGLPLNLKTLLISDCKNLRSLPQYMHRFLSLVYLEIKSYPELESFPEGGLPLNLNTLKISDCKNLRSLPHNMHGLPSLAYLEIKSCPKLESFPEGRLPLNLKTLLISDLKNLKSLPQHMHGLPSLVYLEIKSCPELESFPERGLPLNLNTLLISYCKNLRSLPQHMHGFSSLVFLKINNCPKLESFSEGQLSLNLNKLLISDCKNLRSLPQHMHGLSSLTYLEIKSCPKLESFPERGLPLNLNVLLISDCKNLRSLPQHMLKLLSLAFLKINSCPKLESFPEGGLPLNLNKLLISDCKNLRSLPQHMHMLSSLAYLEIKSCPKLESFPEGGLSLNLNVLLIFDCKNLRSLPQHMHELPSLAYLEISSCPELESFPKGRLPLNLKTLLISDLKNLKSLPQHMHELPSLAYFEIKNCPELESFPEGGLPLNLKTLLISDCKNLRSFPQHMHRFLSIAYLEIKSCPELESFPKGGLPLNLKSLLISDLKNLKSLPQHMHELPSLAYFEIKSCPELESFPERGLSLNLKTLLISNCKNLRSLPQHMHKFLSLAYLEIKSCPEFESFPEGGLPLNLNTLKISDCKNLRSLPQHMHGLSSVAILTIKDCPKLESFPEGGLPLNLNALLISDCKNLRSLPQHMHELQFLAYLEIKSCPELESFLKRGLPLNLNKLLISDCKNLRSLS